jgi:hypothetical protein
MSDAKTKPRPFNLTAGPNWTVNVQDTQYNCNVGTSSSKQNK